MSDPVVSSLATLAAAPTTTTSSSNSKGSSWYQAMAQAWGETLDKQATTIEDISNQVSAGGDDPKTITQLSTESLRMGFLANSSHTAITSAGEALKTMAQKS